MEPPTRKGHYAAWRTGCLRETIHKPNHGEHNGGNVEADEKISKGRDEEPEHYVLLHIHAVGDEAINDLSYRVGEEHRRANIANFCRRVRALLDHPLLRRRERKSANVERRVDEQHCRDLADPSPCISIHFHKYTITELLRHLSLVGRVLKATAYAYSTNDGIGGA